MTNWRCSPRTVTRTCSKLPTMSNWMRSTYINAAHQSCRAASRGPLEIQCASASMSTPLSSRRNSGKLVLAASKCITSSVCQRLSKSSRRMGKPASCTTSSSTMIRYSEMSNQYNSRDRSGIVISTKTRPRRSSSTMSTKTKSMAKNRPRTKTTSAALQ